MHNFVPNCLLLLLLIQGFPANCCIEHERQALLEFKGSLNDPSSRLASWRGDKCCNWTGIKCSNQTGHVVMLDLQNYDGFINIYGYKYIHSLSGKINPVLLSLSDLKHLDLSYNNFSGNRFPQFISSFKNLKYLNLASTGLSGSIPPQLGNLSKLQHLDLSNYMSSTFVSNVQWLSHLSSMKYLDMSGVYFRDSKEWLQTLNMLPHLHTLILDENGLTTIPTSINLVNFSSLEVLYIRDNCFNTRMPDWIGKLTNLRTLQMLHCCFVGPIPNQLGNLALLNYLAFEDACSEGPMPPLHNLKNLTHLHINDMKIGEDIRDVMTKLANDTLEKLVALSFENTSLIGNLTGWLSKMPNLNYLVLSFNNLNGTIPTDIGHLNRLEYLILDDNFFTGEIFENHFADLSMLKQLSLRFNLINFTVSESWIPSFQLELLALDGCKLGPLFPPWLQNQSRLAYIGLSDVGISDTIPDWFWNFSSLSFVNMSNNNLRGNLPLSLEHFTGLEILLLQNNKIKGEIPSLPNSVQILDLSNNLFYGAIEELSCGLNNLTILNLATNNLSGILPFCWPSTLLVVNMAHNNLSGTIPNSMDNLYSLLILQLNNNSITRELSTTLKSWQNLTVLDIGENELSGHMPKWIGKSLAKLEVLRLRSNMISGEIPVQIMYLTNLQVLDLSSNQISGSIPNNMELMIAMTSSTDNKNNTGYKDFLRTHDQFYYISILVETKDLKLEYTKTLSLLRSIDLSSNNLTGEIPQSITTLHGLKNLNLSNNHFHGSIPLRIGEMLSMESLDLSMNELSGIIPESLSNLIFLTMLNLSYNNLSGKIPTGDQLQTLDDPYIYIGNEYLCGHPLSESCNTSEILSGYETEMDNDSEKVLLYLLVVGFVFGSLVVCGILLFNANWRNCFFRVVDRGYDWLFVYLVVYIV